MSTLYANLGREIRRIRKVKGYTQAQLAEMTGLSDNYIGYIERGKQPPSLKTLEKITTVLETPVGYPLYAVENHVSKTGKPDKKELLVNKFSSHLKRHSVKDIQFIFKVVRRMYKVS